MLAIRKHLRPLRQIGAAGIHQIDAGQPVLARDLLRAQMLLHRHRIIGAAFDGAIVAHHHAFAPLDAADAGDQGGAVNGVVVHAVGGERRQFQERRAGIDQVHHAFAGKKLPARRMAFAGFLRPALRGLRAARRQFLHQRAHALGIGAEFGRVSIDLRGKNRQGPLPDRRKSALAALRRQWRGLSGLPSPRLWSRPCHKADARERPPCLPIPRNTRI